MKGETKTGQCNISINKGDSITMAWSGMPIDVPIKTTFIKETISVKLGTYLGKLNDYHVYMGALDLDGYFNIDNNLSYNATIVIDKGKQSFAFSGVGNWSGRKIDGIYYAAFNLPIENENTKFLGAFGEVISLKLTKK